MSKRDLERLERLEQQVAELKRMTQQLLDELPKLTLIKGGREA